MVFRIIVCMRRQLLLMFGCSWAAPGQLLGCSWAAPGLLLGCSWAAPGLLLGRSWAAPGLLLAQELELWQATKCHY